MKYLADKFLGAKCKIECSILDITSSLGAIKAGPLSKSPGWQGIGDNHDNAIFAHTKIAQDYIRYDWLYIVSVKPPVMLTTHCIFHNDSVSSIKHFI